LLNYDTARAIVEEAHRAFSAGDIEAVLRTYTDDFYFKRNAEDFVGPPLILRGKDVMREFLQDLVAKAECMSVVESFAYEAGIGKANASYYLKGRVTGENHASNLRQIVTFRNMQIATMEIYHDRARLNAFFRLIEVPKSPVTKAR
jgi:ketosteroid isomerase-like protein